MSIEVRRLSADDQPAAFALRQNTFSARSEPFDLERDTKWYAPLHRRVGAFDGADLVGHVAAWSFRQHFGRVPLPMAGISGVAVRPDARGRGAASAMLDVVLPDCRERGDLVAALYPANTALYRRHGFEFAGTRTIRTLPGAALAALPRPAERLDVRPARVGDDEELAAIGRVHDAAMDRANGTLADRPASFAGRVVSGRDGHETYLVRRGGQVVAYVWWERTPTGSDDVALSVHELAGLDRDALLTAWRLVASWHPFLDAVTAVGAPADPLGWLLDTGKPELDIEVEQWMLRLVDVRGALEARGYPNHPSGSLQLHVHDASAPWNDGPWRVELEGGHAAVTRGGDGTTQLDVRTLAALFSGWLPVAEARRLGLLAGAADDQLHLLRRAFEAPAPWMLSFF